MNKNPLNIGENFCDFQLGNAFLDMTPKHKQQKEKLTRLHQNLKLFVFNRHQQSDTNRHQKSDTKGEKYLQITYLCHKLFNCSPIQST